jgi:hypothetical protein
MASFKTIQNPTFTADVHIPRVGGDPVKVQFEFRYLTRLEIAALFDKWNDARAALGKAAKKADITWQQATAGQVDFEVQQFKDIVVGWELDDELTDEFIAGLLASCAGMSEVIVSAFQDAHGNTRRGN